MKSECRIRSSETAPGCRQASVHSALTTRYSPFAVRRGAASGFTLIELLVAVGLMALMMSMIATIFYQATRSFRVARASVEIHQNARGAFSMITNDLVAATECSYEDKTGYFALGWIPDPENGRPVQALAFTSLADQSGARPLVPGVSPQVVLIRYTLQSDGAVVEQEGIRRPTFNLIKQVRFPQLVYSFVDMNEFNSLANPGQFTPDEWVTTDVLAFGVLDMKARILYEGDYLDVVDHGRCNGGTADSLVDTDKDWPDNTELPDLSGMLVRLLGGRGARQNGTITGSNGMTIIGAWGWAIWPWPAETTYRIENGTLSTTGPEWLDLPALNNDMTGATYDVDDPDKPMYPMIVIEDVDGVGAMTTYMPYVVEMTLEQTDTRGTRFHTFTQRIYLPASERQ